jgi:hypothetical protein
MDESEEQAYLRGQRAVYLELLQTAMRALGYDDPQVQLAKWISEREQAIMALREKCEEHGDNEWDDDLHLADIINKHLYT